MSPETQYWDLLFHQHQTHIRNNADQSPFEESSNTENIILIFQWYRQWYEFLSTSQCECKWLETQDNANKLSKLNTLRDEFIQCFVHVIECNRYTNQPRFHISIQFVHNKHLWIWMITLGSKHSQDRASQRMYSDLLIRTSGNDYLFYQFQ